ncbi:thermonuclease family protein [Pontixanthobacter sp. CEM42]|uniref:thermonuclease family protein n=1 Tax=Pontixanthobacter sp. CEM42 TaxID=2792077 RepID=UPI001AE05F43|nr:thermonuclease family protein [Pontixanthobacter sp. CEM42]
MLRLLITLALCVPAGSAVALTGTDLRASFAPCGSGKRVTCIVDGDTFWLRGTKIRIADINTPEVTHADCQAEKALGNQATQRMMALLNAAPFALIRDGRDEDRYGRKLRVVTRAGHSLGKQLVREGLAELWNGKRRNWC